MKMDEITYNHAIRDYSIKEDVDEYLGNILGDKFKVYREKWSEVSRMGKELEFPPFLVLEPLWKCNLKCIMCLYSSPEKTSSLNYDEKMPWDMYEQILKEAAKYNLPSMSIGGHCEPFLDIRLIDMINLAREAGIIDIMVNTNATLLSEEVSEKILKTGLTRLRVGFDGGTEETYEKIRVGSDFTKVKNNIINFVRMRDKLKLKLPVVRVSCVHLSVNDQHIDEFIKYWIEKVDYVSVQKYRPHDLVEERSPGKMGVGEETHSIKCNEPWDRLYIRGNGDVYSCCHPAYGPKVGNLKSASLYNIWNSKIMKQLRYATKNNDWKLTPECRKCRAI